MTDLDTKFYIPSQNIKLHYICDECGTRHEDDYDTSVVFDIYIEDLLSGDMISIRPVGRIEDGQIVRVSYYKDYEWNNEEHDFEKYFKRCELPVRHTTLEMSSWWSDWQWRKLRILEKAVKAYEIELLRLRKQIKDD